MTRSFRSSPLTTLMTCRSLNARRWQSWGCPSRSASIQVSLAGSPSRRSRLCILTWRPHRLQLSFFSRKFTGSSRPINSDVGLSVFWKALCLWRGCRERGPSTRGSLPILLEPFYSSSSTCASDRSFQVFLEDNDHPQRVRDLFLQARSPRSFPPFE